MKREQVKAAYDEAVKKYGDEGVPTVVYATILEMLKTKDKQARNAGLLRAAMPGDWKRDKLTEEEKSEGIDKTPKQRFSSIFNNALNTVRQSVFTRLYEASTEEMLDASGKAGVIAALIEGAEKQYENVSYKIGKVEHDDVPIETVIESVWGSKIEDPKAFIADLRANIGEYIDLRSKRDSEGFREIAANFSF